MTDAAAQLERALLQALANQVVTLAAGLFRGAMLPAVIELTDSTSFLGRWISSQRLIQISRTLIKQQPWGVVVEVIKHEMAHQYVDEVLKVTEETAHGRAFQQVCKRFTVDPLASGLPANVAPSDEHARILERIAKLLALADSPNRNEAESAMRAAQRLMLKHNIDESRATGQKPGISYRHLGVPTGRVQEHERILAGILTKHFFVEGIWISVFRADVGLRGGVLEVCGTLPNLEMASYVHAFLLHTADGLWLDHKRARGERSNRDRRTYLAGVMTGFREQLEQQRKVNKEQGLVWVGDPAVATYLRGRYPHIRMVRTAGARRTEAHTSGREAGRNIVLHRPVGEGPRGGGTRLLKG